MRLLTGGQDGNFSLVEFEDDETPPYAILSHTWGLKQEEVSFGDVINGYGKAKPGYRKLHFCAVEAQRDGLKFFWVDTCCINKDSSAELSEAINSMFKWYHEAKHCYVYLADVPLRGQTSDPEPFGQSRWFTRGWTLQELLAPSSVRFYNANGHLLGSKESLLHILEQATGICRDALQGKPLSKLSIDERLSWVAHRSTKKAEDIAYCLLGIFDIHMPLIYGEGRNEAFKRLLRQIDESHSTQGLGSSSYSGFNTTFTDLMDTMSSRDEVAPRGFASSNLGYRPSDLEELRYPDMDDRRAQVRPAQAGTYEWILRPNTPSLLQEHDVLHWLSSAEESHHIYCIFGKPGSGKSTLMKFLNEQVTSTHLLPWAQGKKIVRLQHYFWNPGSTLQRSQMGMIQSLLFQIMSQEPRQDLVLPRRAQVSSLSVLANAIQKYMTRTATSQAFFVLIDGLDELEGGDIIREDLIEFLIEIAGLPNVKICLSCRPWDVFCDAFHAFPQLRLEKLTRGDIKIFVKAQLLSHPQFRGLARVHDRVAGDFVRQLCEKASGVFLWVRLVTRELLAGLRQGDRIKTLQRRLDSIPADLNDYFERMIDSIDPDLRREASILLQIALYEEEDFESVHAIRLMDLSYTEEESTNFVLSSERHMEAATPAYRQSLNFRLASTLRRLNACCKGLLECHYDYGTSSEVMDLHVSPPVTSLVTDLDNFPFGEMGPEVDCLDSATNALLQNDRLTVHFFHRTCYDYLMTPEAQHMLRKHSNGPFEVQNYLLNARVCEFMELSSVDEGLDLAMRVASNILSSFARPSSRDSAHTVALAGSIRATFEELMDDQYFNVSGLYISPSVVSWEFEESSFLTLAIDFDIVSYVKHHLTPEYVQTKSGRPILDYILRPRFISAEARRSMRIGNQKPSAELLRMVLEYGADPNQLYGDTSVWALFICFFSDLLDEYQSERHHPEYAAALEIMIRAGAARALPGCWLLHNTEYELYSYRRLFIGILGEDRLNLRWQSVHPRPLCNEDSDSEPCYAVADLLESFRFSLGSDIDRLKTLLDGTVASSK